MSEEEVYSLNEEMSNSIVDKDIGTMDEWLLNMDDETLTAFHRICNKNPDDRSEKEDYEISKHALVLYCRELGLNELAITNDLISKISGTFCVNIIFESLRRSGLAETDGPILIYKDCKLKITEKGRKALEESKKKSE
ncbi:MAG: hypothetical protein AABY15_01755 [Nanoarchaeota archaeon]